MMKPRRRLLFPAFSAAAFLISAAAIPAAAEDKAPTTSPTPAPATATSTTEAASAPAREQQAAPPATNSDTNTKAQAEIPYLGIGIVSLPESLTAQLKLKPGFGLLVTNVVGPAAQAGLEENDVLLMLDDQHLVESSQFSVLVRSHKPGDEVTLTYVRGGERKTMKLAVGKRLAESGKEGRPGRSSFGIDVPRSTFMRREMLTSDKYNLLKGTNANAAYGHSLPSFNTSRTFTRDGKLEYELQVENSSNVFVVRKEGKEIFRGPVNTDEEREKVPQEYRDSLKRMEEIRARVTPRDIPLPQTPGSPMSGTTTITLEPQITADNMLFLDPTSILMEDEEE